MRRPVSGIALLLAIAGCKNNSPVEPPPPPPSAPTVSLTTTALEIRGEGTERTLTATVSPGSASVAWRVDKASVATVTASGATATVRAVRAGAATVTVTATSAGQTAEASAAVTVIPIVRSITLPRPTDTVAVGASKTLTATVTADSGATTSVTWRSAAPAIATVTAAGVITGVTAGTTTITVLAVDDTTKRANLTLVVAAGAAFPIRFRETLERQGGGGAFSPVQAITMLPNGSVIGVGDGGVITTRSLGGQWTQAPSGVTTNQLYLISNPAPDSVWITGFGGNIFRKTTTGWTTETTGTTLAPMSLDVGADGNGFVLLRETTGAKRVFQRSAGTWTEIAVPNDPLFAHVTSLTQAGGSLFAMGSNSSGQGGLWRRTGGTWAKIAAPPIPSFGVFVATSALALSATDVLVAGEGPTGTGAIYRRTASAWVVEWTSPLTTTANLAGSLTRCADGSISTVTFQGLVLNRSGTSWTIRPEPAYPGLPVGWVSHLGCRSAGSYAFVSKGGVLGLVDGGVASYERWVAPEGPARISARAGVAMAGTETRWLATHWDGTRWIPFHAPLGLFNLNGGPAFALTGPTSAIGVVGEAQGSWNGTAWTWGPRRVSGTALWASSPNDVWAVGRDQRPTGPAGLARNDGNGWDFFAVPGSLTAVDGSGPGVMMAVSSNQAYRRTAAGIQVDNFPSLLPLVRDIAVFSATSALAIGQAQVFRFDGTSWTTVANAPAGDFATIAARSPTEVYVFASDGKVWGYDGNAWTLLTTLTNAARHARFAGSVLIGVGDKGSVVYGEPLQN